MIKLLALTLIVSTMLGAGLQIDRARLLSTLRDVSLLGRALVANFVLVPLFAYALIRLFHVQDEVALGIMLMAMAAGVPFLANAAGRKQGGSLAFALEASFIFAMLSVVTLPLTAALLLPPDSLAEVRPVKTLLPLVLFQLIPLLVGGFLSSRLPAKTLETLEKASRLVFFAAALGLVVVLFPKILSSFGAVYGDGHFLIIAAIGLFSVACGWLLGGPDRAYRRTLSIATMLRNIGTAMMIATSTSGENGATLIAPAVISYFVINFALSFVFRIYYKRTAAAPAAA
jgi:BASS family bile acid:Na+ symporter